MDDITPTFIGDNHPDDVRWLSSLSESELDILISLKKLALQRAQAVGHESLAQKIDLKMLRALGFVLMHHVKEKVNDLQLVESNGLKDIFDGCNLLKMDVEDRVEMAEQMKSGEQVKMREQVKVGDQTRPRSNKMTPRSKRRKIDK